MQNIKLLCGSLDRASQQWGVPTCIAVIRPPFVSGSSFLVCGARTTESWHFQLILLFTAHVSTKLSKSKSGSLYS